MRTRILKKLVFLIISIVMLISCTISNIYAESLPSGNAIGAGNAGPYKSPGIMVKFMLYDPGNSGITAANYSKDPESDFIEFKSKSERTVFEMATKDVPMDSYELTGCGQDAMSLSQLYVAADSPSDTYDGDSMPWVSFLTGRNFTYTDPGYASHRAIISSNVPDGAYGGRDSYKQPEGLGGLNNYYMQKLLQATDNGKTWDKARLNKALDEIWAYNVLGDFELGSPGVRLRYDLARMLGSNNTNDLEVQRAMSHISWVMSTEIARDSWPRNCGFKIETDAQATNIRNLYTVMFGLVLANPSGGIHFDTGQVQYMDMFKGEHIHNCMRSWINAGGNSNESNQHIAIKFESYGIKRPSTNLLYADRWDYAYEAAAQYGSRENLIPLMNATLTDRTNDGYYTTWKDYPDDANGTYLRFLESIQRKLSSVGQPFQLDARAAGCYSNYSSSFSIFGDWRPGMDGVLYDSGNTYRYRGMLEYSFYGYKNRSNETINLGYTYLSPMGISSPPAQALTPPDMKQDAEASTEKTILKENEKAEVSVSYNIGMPTILDQDEINKYNISIKKEEWDTAKEEALRLANLVHRAHYYSNDRLVSQTNKYMPVTITITRGGTAGTDNIIDSLSGSLDVLKNCSGGHQFQIIEKHNNTVEIKFNLVADTWCSDSNRYVIEYSHLKNCLGHTPTWHNVENCVTKQLIEGGLPFTFIDKDIECSAGNDSKTDITYTFSAKMDTPQFKIEESIFGTADVDKVAAKTQYKFYGYSVKPEDTNASYPKSDYVKGGDGKFYLSEYIQRKVSFTRKIDKVPIYNNVGYEAKKPYYAEIKQGSPSYEQYEAMSGTPTTENLYMSVGATDFRVSFEGSSDPALNPADYLKYTYIVNVSGCTGAGGPCTGCGSCTQACPGHTSGDPPVTSFCSSHPTHTTHHPIPHTWTYVVNIPIGVFNYFDMTDTEVWRLASWGLSGHETFLTAPNPQKDLSTKFWGYNQRNYTSGNGRLIFTDTQNSNSQGSSAKYGNQTRTISISAGTHAANVAAAVSAVNAALASERPVGAIAVSDYMVLGTSEGYQTPFFYTQESKTKVTPSSAGTFSGEGGSITCPTSIEFDAKTNNDYWWQNSDKLNCAQPDNGWINTSITYGGYNGKYQDLSTKYINTEHSSFTSATNKAAQFFSTNSLNLDSHPNAIIEGSGPGIGIGKGNYQHIVTGMDVPDTIANGEYNTGKMFLQYNRIMLYDNNSYIAPNSNTPGLYAMTSPGVFRLSSVPYYDGASEVNDIVVHDPVSAEYSIVVSNPKEYDLRTNAALMQGGDPIGLKGGACPGIGCTFSTLKCTRPIVEHTAACYKDVEGATQHVGGNNAHVHDGKCFHTHVEACYSGSGSNSLSAGVTYPSSGVYVHSFVATSNGSLTFYSTSRTQDPRGVVEINGSRVVDNDDGNGDLNFNCGTVAFNKGDTVKLFVYAYGGGPGAFCQWYSTITMRSLICGLTEGSCNGYLNTHVCTAACTKTYTKTLVCTDPHHYVAGQPIDATSLSVHYPLGDDRCWTPCNDPKKHGDKDSVTLPDGTVAQMGGTFINIDREFRIYYPFLGDFAQDPTMEGIKETSIVRGKGYVNNMNTQVWTSHRWVSFPVNVIDPAGVMRLAFTQIDLNQFSTTDTTFQFYSVLANTEYAAAKTVFTSTAINGPSAGVNDYFNDSTGTTNKDRQSADKNAAHSASKTQSIDVVGSIGALTVHDTGDFRFSTTFKTEKADGKWLVPNLIKEVDLTKPNFVAADTVTVRRDTISKAQDWLNTYGTQSSPTGGKDGGTDGSKTPIELPLTPADNVESEFRNQPMRPGYDIYMDLETIGNYYGETLVNVGGNETNNGVSTFLDTQMQSKVQIRPLYYSLDMVTGKYTPVDVYYGVNGEYMGVNQYAYDPNNSTGVQNYYYYLDWLNEKERRSYTPLEQATTNGGKTNHDAYYFWGSIASRLPTNERDVLGSANILFLNDLNRTYIGTSSTYGTDKNPNGLSGSKELNEQAYNEQSQRWHFTLGLPSSSVFVEAGKDCTEANIKALQNKDRVIVSTLDIKARGSVWTLDYSKGLGNNGNKFQIFEGGKFFDPPMFDKDGKPTNDPALDVTSSNIIVTVYPPDKTSKDDVGNTGIQ